MFATALVISFVIGILVAAARISGIGNALVMLLVIAISVFLSYLV